MSLTPRFDGLQRNVIINGDFSINQRNTNNIGYTLGSGQLYYVDRFAHYCQGPTSKSFGISTQPDVPTLLQSGYPVSQSLQFVNNNSWTPSDSSDVAQTFFTVIEGFNYQRLHGKIVTLGFWFKPSLSGTYSISLTAASTNHSYVTTFTATANVWQYVAKVIQLETLGGYNLTNGNGIRINIASVAGSNCVTSNVDQWTTGFFLTSPGVTPWNATAGSQMNISMVSLVEGISLDPTSFHLAGLTYNAELELCQRYFEKSYEMANIPGSLTYVGCHTFREQNNQGNPSVSWKVRKRTTPTATVWNPGTGAPNSCTAFGGANFGVSFQNVGETNAQIQGMSSTGNTLYAQWTVECDF